MTPCTCPRTALTFASGVVLERCAEHEQQRWVVDGRPADREDVLPVLKDLFVDRRGDRSADRRPPRPRLARVPVAALPAALEGQDDGERLTALLRARGLPGTWAVA